MLRRSTFGLCKYRVWRRLLNSIDGRIGEFLCKWWTLVDRDRPGRVFLNFESSSDATSTDRALRWRLSKEGVRQ